GLAHYARDGARPAGRAAGDRPRRFGADALPLYMCCSRRHQHLTLGGTCADSLRCHTRHNSSRLNVHAEVEACLVHEVLEREPNELLLAVAERSRELRGSRWADCLAALLDVAQVRAGDAELFRELCLGHLLTLADGSEKHPQGQWSA